MGENTWTCQRVSGGQKCGHVNLKRYQLCRACGKRRAAKKAKAHLRFMDAIPYEELVPVFGEICGVCGRSPKPGKKLHRDHDHKTGEIRGLVCWRCNSLMPYDMTLELSEAVAAYLHRHAERR